MRLAFEREDDDEVLGQLAERVSPRVLEAPARLDEVRRELDEYFAGGRDHFELPLDWRLSAGFRRTVLETLYADVDYGRTVSYLELATMVGNPKASRAVGTAMATNPIPIVVPCHRVLRTGGQLGGYGGGLPAKIKLLELGEPAARSSEPSLGEHEGRVRPDRQRRHRARSGSSAVRIRAGAEDEGAVVAAEAEAVAQRGAGVPGSGLAHHEVDARGARDRPRW